MNKKLLATVIVPVSSVVLPGIASAAPATIPADPTGGYMADSQDFVQTWVLTYGVPVLFGLTLLGIGIKLARRWMKRAGGAV